MGRLAEGRLGRLVAWRCVGSIALVLTRAELLRRSRWTVAFTLFALIYAINVRLYGEDANFLADFVAKWSDAAMGKPPAVPAVSPA